eukprot:1158597-Pelagomonas_calceolata.AAC.2
MGSCAVDMLLANSIPQAKINGARELTSLEGAGCDLFCASVDCKPFCILHSGVHSYGEGSPRTP